MVAAIGAQGDALLILVAQGEVRGRGPDGQHQRFPARDFGCTNRLALQSPRLTDDVGIRPGGGRRLGDLGGQHVAGLAGLGCQHPDHAVFGQRA